jgi:membrane protease subunit HflK
MEAFPDFPRRPPRPPSPEAIDRILPWLPFLILLALAALLVGGTSYTVGPSEQAVLFRFGKYKSTTLPGLHLKLPIADRVIKVNVAEHSLRLPYGAADDQTDTSMSPAVRRATASDEEATLMLTGDLNTASVEWTMQWRVSTPSDYAIRFPESPDDLFASRLISSVARTAMNRLVGDYSFDEVIGAERSDIAAAAQQEVQEVLDGFSCGITITALQMQRVVPPARVRPSFEEVNSSIQEKQKSENQGESQRNKLLPEARAEKDKLIREAEGYAARRRAEATGEIKALEAQSAAYRKAPEVTRRRLYLEAMQEVLQNAGGRTILDDNLKQVVPLLPLGGDAGRILTPPPAGGAR